MGQIKPKKARRRLEVRQAHYDMLTKRYPTSCGPVAGQKRPGSLKAGA